MPRALVNTQLLRLLGVSDVLAAQFTEPLRAACEKFEINTPERVAMFMGQVLHESGRLSHVKESLFYSTPERIMVVFPSRVKTLAEAKKLTKAPQALANRVYSGRLGNGAIDTNDGWAFIGRGLIQLTGRDNYTAAEKALGFPYSWTPWIVSDPEHAALTAAWFWASHDCNRLADERNLTEITRRINGPALLGLVERRELTRAALHAMG